MLIKPNEHAAIILAGGPGERLRTLTAERTKPAVPIFGTYLIGDFALSSAICSQMFGNIMVLTQYKSDSLLRHLSRMYPSAPLFSRFIDPVPPQQRKGKGWYRHTADAVWQNEHQWRDKKSVTILSADHVTKIDFAQMYEVFYARRSDFLIAGMIMDAQEAAGRYGVFVCDPMMKILGFQEKPEVPIEVPNMPGKCFASAGIYMADTRKLHEALRIDAKKSGSKHDFGGDVIPWMIDNGFSLHCYDLTQNRIEGEPGFFWEDVGTLKTYHETNMKFASNQIPMNFHNEIWKVRSFNHNASAVDIRGNAVIAHVKFGAGCVVEQDVECVGAVLSPEVFISQRSNIHESVLFHRVRVGRECYLRRVIVDKDVTIPDGTRIGHDAKEDEARGLLVENGITVVPKGYVFS